jgi:hypothetical protein
MTANIWGFSGGIVPGPITSYLRTGIYVSTAGQTTFNLPADFSLGTSSLLAIVDGFIWPESTYTRPTNTQVVFNEPMLGGREVEFIVGRLDITQLPSLSITNLLSGGITRLQSQINAEYPSITDYGAVPDGVTDNYIAITVALNSGYGRIYVPPGIFCTSQEIVVPDNVSLVGAQAFWKRRVDYAYSAAKHSVIKYIGIGGTNSCVIRCSNKAVGTVGVDFSGAETDDLLLGKITGIHIDANNLADYGWYFYRAGNNASVDDITAEKAKVSNFVFLGMFAAHWGNIGSYLSENTGVIVAEDIFGWGGNEFKCFDFTISIHTCFNGTSGAFITYPNAAFNKNAGCRVYGARGCHYYITAENNLGYGAIIGSNATGPCIFTLRYIEANAEALYVDYRVSFTAPIIDYAFIDPQTKTEIAAGGVTGRVTITSSTDVGVPTTDGGPPNPNEWLIINNMHGGIVSQERYIPLKSNTRKFRYRTSTPFTVFSDRVPAKEGVVCQSWFLADSTLSDTRQLSGASLSRIDVGRYLFTFGDDHPILGTFQAWVMPDTDYVVSLSMWGSTATVIATLHSKSAAAFEIRTYSTADFTTLIDSGKFIEVLVTRRDSFGILPNGE